MENLQTAGKFQLFSNWLAQKFGVINCIVGIYRKTEMPKKNYYDYYDYDYGDYGFCERAASTTK